MAEKVKTLICGSTFGQFYIEALKLLKEDFEIVGLFAHGSERSHQCAKNYNIQLYTDIKELPDDIDLACVVVRSRAIGGRGTDLAVQFLEKGIHVIQEQPIHPKDLEMCYRTARKHNVCFQTGNLYPNLVSVRRFIVCANALNKIKPPVYINASFCPQVSYPAVDILAQSLPSIRAWDVHMISKDCGPFEVLSGTLGNIPITLEYHNEINPKDPDNYMHLLHNIVFVYESGRLTLEDTFGPLIWNPRMHIPIKLYDRGDIGGEYPEYLDENSMEILGDYKNSSFKKNITKGWPSAIAKDLLSIKDLILKNKNANQKAQQELLCSRQWSRLTKIMGYAQLLKDCKHEHISVNMLKITANSIQ